MRVKITPRRVSPFSRGVVVTRARVSLALLSLRKNGDYSYSRPKPYRFNNTETLPTLSSPRFYSHGQLTQACRTLAIKTVVIDLLEKKIVVGVE